MGRAVFDTRIPPYAYLCNYVLHSPLSIWDKFVSKSYSVSYKKYIIESMKKELHDIFFGVNPE